jgi:hypothetical protein
MAMSMQERKAAQRARPDGYAKSREADWKAQGIIDARYSEYLEKIVAQGCKCAMCPAPIDNRSPYDHDHATGKARGILCQDCNLSLGFVEAHKKIFDGASEYLHQWSAA